MTKEQEARARVLAELSQERDSQNKRFGDQSHLPNGTGHAPGYHETLLKLARASFERAEKRGLLTWEHILAEEFYEVLVETDPVKLRAELVQLGAVCVAFVQAIDTKAGK